MATQSGQEANPLRALKINLERAQKNTSKMVAKVQRIEGRLLSIERDMEPVQNATARYTVAKENIAETLHEVEKTHEYFRIAVEVDPIIASGLEMRNAAKKASFFNAMGRLTEARLFFKSHKKEIKSAGSALDNIEKLLKVRNRDKNAMSSSNPMSFVHIECNSCMQNRIAANTSKCGYVCEDRRAAL